MGRDSLTEREEMSEENLKPCPFCRGEAAIKENRKMKVMVYSRLRNEKREVMEYFVYCRDCGARAFQSESKAMAQIFWNRRL